MKKKYYTDLDDISVYNWYKLNETNDYKWLCRPNQRPDAAAVAVYQDLLYQFESMNLEVLQEKKDISVQVINLILEISKSDKIDYVISDAISTLLRALMINPAAADTQVLLSLLKEPDHRFQLSMIDNAKKKLQETIKAAATQAPESLHERTAQMEKHFGINIDVRKVSVKQYQAYETVIVNEYKKSKHGTR